MVGKKKKSLDDSSHFDDNEEEMEEAEISNLDYRINGDKNEALLFFRGPVHLHFKGKLEVEILKGSGLRCLGHEIKDREVVYSPRGYSLLSLEVIEEENGSVDEPTKRRLINYGIGEPEISSSRIIALFKRFRDERWLTFLNEHLIASNDKIAFFKRDSRIPSYAIDECSRLIKLEKTLDINLFVDIERMSHDGGRSNRARFFRSLPEWESVIRSVLLTNDRKVRVLTAGGKGVGKSTLNRYIINRLLKELPKSAAILIDLDPGQAEFTIPGFISATKVTKPILGPNFCNLDRETSYNYFVGDVNVSNVSYRYLQCLHSLYSACSSDPEISELPWIINTMGFNRGLGNVFMVETIRIFQPSTIVNIVSRFFRKNYELDFSPEYIQSVRHFSWTTQPGAGKLRYNVLTFEALPESHTAKDMRSKDLWGIPEARKLRDIVLLSYLGRHFSPHLNSCTPYKIRWKDLAIQILNGRVHTCQTLSVLNGSLVSLGRIHLEKDAVNVKNEIFRIVRPLVITKSLGVGIVRAVDVKSQSLFILTELQPPLLDTVNCLSMGAIYLPQSVFLHPENQNSKNVPYIRKQRKLSNPLDQPWVRSHKPRPEN